MSFTERCEVRELRLDELESVTGGNIWGFLLGVLVNEVSDATKGFGDGVKGAQNYIINNW